MKNDNIIMFHGDLVFESTVLNRVSASEKSCMAVSSLLELSEKDFKAVIENVIKSGRYRVL